MTVLLLCARLWPAATLYDPVSGTVPPALYLKIPWTYLVLAPLFTLWDGVSMLSMSRLIGFLSGLVVLYVVWRLIRGAWRRYTGIRLYARTLLVKELLVLIVAAVLFSGFVVGGALWHRPCFLSRGRLHSIWWWIFTATPTCRTTFRTHGCAVRHRSQPALALASWLRCGIHHRPQCTEPRVARASRRSGASSTTLCPGIEISAWRAHIVLLGSTAAIRRSDYNGSLDELYSLLATGDSGYEALSVASLPEYRRYHWNRLDSLAEAGLDGFEIVNASPKANEITRSEVDTVVAVARTHNLFVVGVSDSHGWGATSMVWNLVRSTRSAPDTYCSTILRQLRTGFGAAQIVERHRLRPDDWWPMWLTPFGVVWETWRGMGWILTAAWLLWIWGWVTASALRFVVTGSKVSSSRPTSLTG